MSSKITPHAPPHYNIRGARIAGGPVTLDIEEWLDSNVWLGVVSSTVAAIRYNAKTHNLMVEFIGGENKPSNQMYVYRNVPRDVARDMYNSSSQGKFIHYRLKGKYPVDEPVVKI